MNNKILVEIDIPHLDEKYNIYLPLNKNVADILTLLSKALKDVNLLYKLDFDNCQLYNSDTGIIYPGNTIIRESNIRNGSKLIIM